jgi:hypothetical protein
MTVPPLALGPTPPVFTTTMVVEPAERPPVADVGRFEVAMSAPRLTVDQVQAPGPCPRVWCRRLRGAFRVARCAAGGPEAVIAGLR